MSAPLLTWNFTGTGELGTVFKTSLSRPVDAKLEDMVAELETYGYKNPRLVSKEWERWAWPGGYPIYYVCEDGGVLCSTCVNAEIEFTGAPDAEAMWKIVGSDINWEDDVLQCCHCGQHVESAYGETADRDTCDQDEDAAQQELESREEQ